MELEYQNIRIRNAEVYDAEQLAIWWNDGQVMKHAGYPKGLGTSTEKVAAQIMVESDSTVRRYIIMVDNRRIGEMVHRQVNPKVCEIGIKICEESMQNHGYGKKILSLFIYGLFDRLGYQIIQLDTDLTNLRAQHVYESLGFRKLGINPNSWIDQMGRNRSSVDYVLTRDALISYLDE